MVVLMDGTDGRRTRTSRLETPFHSVMVARCIYMDGKSKQVRISIVQEHHSRHDDWDDDRKRGRGEDTYSPKVQFAARSARIINDVKGYVGRGKVSYDSSDEIVSTAL